MGKTINIEEIRPRLDAANAAREAWFALDLETPGDDLSARIAEADRLREVYYKACGECVAFLRAQVRIEDEREEWAK